MRALKRFLDKTLETGLWVSMLAMTLTVIWQVFTRFVMRDPSSWTEELAIFLLIWIGLLGSAVALRRKAHLGIDIIVTRMSERWARLTAIFVFSCVIFFALTVLFIGGIKMVSVVLMNNQISPALGVKMGYIYLALPISGFFITIYAMEFIVTEIKLLCGKAVEIEPETGRIDVPIE